MNVLQELIAHFGRNNVKDYGKKAKIICPFHNNGQEKTPSLIVNLTEPYIGRSFCFACGAKKSFDELLNRDPSETEHKQIFVERVRIKDDEKESNPAAQVNPKWLTWKRWPKDEVWRTIPGWLVHDLGGRIEQGKYGKQLALPVKQNDEVRGLIHCTLHKAKLSYIYDKHKFIKSSMFPYDYTAKLLRKSRTKTLFIVEGPRDACRMLTYDLPTLANLGGVTTWTKEKAALIEMLNPKQMIIATDPDTIGDELFELIQDGCPNIRSCRLLFKIKRNKAGKVIQKNDPGNMNEIRLAWLQQNYG